MSNGDTLLNNQRLLNIGLLNNETARIEQNSNLRQQNNILREQANSVSTSVQTLQQREALEDLEIDNISLQNDNTALQNDNIILNNELASYKDLLAKPMHEIANSNENFKKTYHLQQELLANWMVSQRAFKELAIDLGLDLGKLKEEIISEGMNQRIKVLDNTTKHGNDLGDDSNVKPYIDKIKAKL